MESVREPRFDTDLARGVHDAVWECRRFGTAAIGGSGSPGGRRSFVIAVVGPPSVSGPRSDRNMVGWPHVATSLREIRWRNIEMVIRRRRCTHGL